MERSLSHGLQRLLHVLLLSALLLTLALLPQTSCQVDSENIVCGIERVTVEVKVEGCEPTTTTVRACNGACISAVSTILQPPFMQDHCTSCRPTYVSNYSKRRTLQMMCNGEEVTKTVYFPFIKECGCVNTTSSVDY